MNDREFRRQLREKPENLQFASVEQLIAEAGCQRDFPRLRARALAELVTRWFVAPARASKMDAELRRLLPESLLCRLVLLRSETCPRVVDETSPLAEVGEAERVVEFEIRQRLIRLLNRTDGFIPVFATQNGGFAFLPFQLIEGGAGKVYYADGQTEIQEWTSGCSRLLNAEGFSCKVFISPDPAVPTLVGNSLMLPVFLALKRRRNYFKDRGMEFAPWRLLATGAFSANDQLMPVRTEEKVEGCEHVFPDSVFVYPDDAKVETRPGLTPLPLEERPEEILARVSKALEQRGVAVMSLRYVKNRIADVTDEIRYRTTANWRTRIAWIEHLLESVNQERNPSLALAYHMLLAESCCHAGLTKRAMEENALARRLAQETGNVGIGLRLQVELMVNLQDSARLEEGLALATKIEHELAGYSGEDRDDLLMRLNGTKGQLLAESALLALPGRNAEDDRQNALVAFKAARQLAWNIAEETGSPEAEREVAQDMNYVCLWYALFDPESEAAEAAFRDARNHIEKNLARPEFAETKQVNMNHYTRIFAKRVYSSWRNGSGKISPADCPSFGGKVDRWIFAVYARCLGAVLAATGHVDEAAGIFDEAERQLTQDECGETVVLGIRLTLLAQGHASLMGTRRAELGAKCRELALCIQRDFPYLGEYANLVDWENLLKQDQVSPSEVPPTYY